MAEAGMPNFDTSLWLGLAGPAGLSRPVIDKLSGVAKRALQTPQSAAALLKQGYDSHYLAAAQFAAFIKSEHTRWSVVARAAGLTSKS
jgi:tripartite-type tricarboxylate transporter receptor subunit TctC